MASRSKGGSRLPEEQLREKEKDGRIRRFICDVLTLRVLGYVCAQPASFSFILSFLIITLTMPPMALYIKYAPELPDLDTMGVRKGAGTSSYWVYIMKCAYFFQSWNAYLGKLPELGLCVSGDSYAFTAPSAAEEVASAFVDFDVASVVLDQYQFNVSLLVAVMDGSQLNTKIKSNLL